MFKLDLEKVEEPEVKLPTSAASQEKQDNSRKTFTSALLTMTQSLIVWITANCGKFLNRLEYQTTLSVSREICVQVKKQQLELDMEQLTGSKSGKDYVKAVYCHPDYLIYMQSTSCEMQDEAQTGIKIAGRSFNNFRYADNNTLRAESKELKNLLMKVREKSEKVG